VSNEPARKPPVTTDTAQARPAGPRRSIELDSREALRLLASVSFGRIVFTRHALPTVRPVNHVLDNGHIVIRTHEGAALTARAGEADGQGVVVPYEADSIDPVTHLGWSASPPRTTDPKPSNRPPTLAPEPHSSGARPT
jgi:pyridoxamine 5'-phosphate oxidase-like protein